MPQPTELNQMIFLRGVPKRLQGKRPYEDLTKKFKTFEFGKGNAPKVPTKQRKSFDNLAEYDTGWLAYFCSESFLDTPRYLAACLMHYYTERGLHAVWLSSFEKAVERRITPDTKLIVFDALFLDGTPYRRERFYELLNHHANLEDVTVIILGLMTPIELARTMGLRPDFAFLTK